jgi:hypothetical protein
MRHFAQRRRQNSHSQRRTAGEPGAVEVPVRLVMVAVVLGMLVGAVAAPEAPDRAALDAWLSEVMTAEPAVGDDGAGGDSVPAVRRET